MKESLRGFIFEMSINIFLIAIFCAYFLIFQVSLKAKYSMVSIGCYVLIVCLFLHSLKSIKIGFQAMLDLIFKKVIECECIILSQIPYECTWLSDRFDKERHIISPIRFCVSIKQKNGKIISLISPNFIESNGEKCTILIAKYSHIIIGKVDNNA